MNSLSLFGILLTLSSLFGILNDRTFRLPPATGILVIALAVSLIVLAIDPLFPNYDFHAISRDLVGSIDLPQTLLDGALTFLLFAGALQVDLDQLWARKYTVLALAFLGTSLSIVLFGGAMWLVFPLAGTAVPLIWCIVLGTILAPTDPVSVVAMLRRLGLPSSIQAIFAGESLFNDGIAVVAFNTALGVAVGKSSAIDSGVLLHLLVEAGGGGLIGSAFAWLAMRFTRTIDDAHLELMISLALATGTFSLASALHMSGPLAVVAAGLSFGSRRSRKALTSKGLEELTTFWILVDEILTTLLFMLIGFEVVSLSFKQFYLVAGLAAIPISVAARFVSVLISTFPIHLHGDNRGGALAVLTWGGLRGGISIALALGLPKNDVQPALLAVCYCVVLFTILVQGLTIERIVHRFYPATADVSGDA